ncbi:putative zinc finger protein [Orchesella cincta]|uniref:Putative zinc finger protein n=1 Tax=Orchesella cincta TaxID=48709 RepID=A0A1D2MCW5_ORCCI|nr:putative zinc finger protein [Orchesella cincta]
MESCSNCIFCTSPCQSKFTIFDGKPVKLKKDECENDNLSANCEFGDDSNIETNLKVILITRKILNIERRSCSKFLRSLQGQLHPEFWLEVCSSCDQLVSEFWAKSMEIGRLERRLKEIKRELTEFIQKSGDVRGEIAAGIGPVWNKIRERILTGVEPKDETIVPFDEDKVHADDDNDDDFDPTPFLLQEAEDSDFEVPKEEEVDDRSLDEDDADRDSDDYKPIPFSLEEADGSDFEVPNEEEDGSSSDEDLKSEDISKSANPGESSPTQPESSSPPPEKPRKRSPYLKCAECGDLSVSIMRFKHHSQLHKLNKGTVCPECGWLCGNLSTHTSYWHPTTGLKLTMEERLAKREVRVMQVISDESPEDQDAFEIIRSSTKKKLFRCKLCPATNRRETRIRSHLAGHKNPASIPCKQCGWIVEPNKMGFHIAKTHHLNRPSDLSKKRRRKSAPIIFRHSCSECKAHYRNPGDIRKHKQLHESGKGEVCDECGFLVSKLRSHKLRMHKPGSKKKKVDEKEVSVVVSEEIPYYCDHDHMIFPYLSRFLVHRKCYHANEPLLECNECESKLESKQLLRIHLSREHGQKEEIPMEELQPQLCQYCKEEFGSKMKKDLHVAQEHQDKLLSCETCNVRFTKFADYQTHMDTTRAHANKKLFSCEVCGKTFNSNGILRDHRVQEHYEVLGLEPHRCSYCGQILANKSVLDRHIRSQHTKQWKLTCEYCGKGFNAQGRLQAHIKVKHKEVVN